jgi:GNAT superfamily N-acetyltransferase
MDGTGPRFVAFHLRPVDEADRPWVLNIVLEWGSDFVVSRGRKLYPQELPGFCAIGPGGERLGLATYEIIGDECQVVTLHALRQWAGIGTALLEAARDAAASAGCRRLWLITTNDNLDALRFYQRRGMHLVAVHSDLREVARSLKPLIPLVGNHDIPIRDEIELEMSLEEVAT